MCHRFQLLAMAMFGCVAVCTSCSSRHSVGDVLGTATVDGALVEVGTIHFQSIASPGMRGSGAAIMAGQFQLPSEHGLVPGKYTVAVQASKSTGRTFRDPQRGDVPVMTAIELIDSPQEIELTRENAGQLELNFSTGVK